MTYTFMKHSILKKTEREMRSPLAAREETLNYQAKKYAEVPSLLQETMA